MFSVSSVAAAGIFGVLCIIIPIAAAVIFKVKNKDMPFSPFFIGAAAFIIFALVLEQLLHSVMIPVIGQSKALYVIYGALAAGVFEETARFAAYKTVMKKSPDGRSAVLYGLGHGGCESIMIAGLSLISLCISMAMANSMGLEGFIALSSGGDENTAELLRSQMDSLVGYGFANGALALFERLVTITLHTALSVIMFGVLRGKMICYPVCILVHAIADVPAAMYQTGLMPLYLTYVFMVITVGITVYAAAKAYKRFC